MSISVCKVKWLSKTLKNPNSCVFKQWDLFHENTNTILRGETTNSIYHRGWFDRTGVRARDILHLRRARLPLHPDVFDEYVFNYIVLGKIRKYFNFRATTMIYGICCFSSKYASQISKRKYWIAQNRDNVSGWNDISTI
jgi:hypothetical protein